MRNEQTSAATREREKATHGIGVVRQGGCTRVEAGGGLKEVMGEWREREREGGAGGREGEGNDVAINGETRTQEGNARKKKRRGGGEWW